MSESTRMMLGLAIDKKKEEWALAIQFAESSREMVTEELLSMVPENVLEKDVPFAAFPETWIE